MGRQAPVIAIVDDDVEVGRALKRLLQSFGYAAEPFNSGLQFFDWLERTMPDCVLLDIQMPVMSGFEIHERLLQQHPSLPCIFITASGSVADAHRASERGAELMRKPLGEEQLIDAIQRATAGR